MVSWRGDGKSEEGRMVSWRGDGKSEGVDNFAKKKKSVLGERVA